MDRRFKAIVLLLTLAVAHAQVVIPGAIMRSIATSGGGGTIGPISVANDAGDGEIFDTFFWSDGENNDGIGHVAFFGGLGIWNFFRFVLPSSIANGATITSATIELWGEGNSGWVNGESDLVVVATDSANASAPTTAGQRPTSDGGSTTLTTASVAWNNVTWTTDAWNSTTVTTLIQELVNDNSGLASGAGIVLWVRGVSSPEAFIQLNEFVGEANVAKLTIVVAP